MIKKFIWLCWRDELIENVGLGQCNLKMICSKTELRVNLYPEVTENR